MSKKSTKAAKPSKPKAVVKPAKVKAVKAEAPAKIEREVRNDIPRPGSETICGSVWGFLDTHKDATAKDVIEGIKDINPATARTQTQRYRKFHGAK